MLKRASPDATVIGLDGDPAVLAIARQKAEAAGLAVDFREGLASAPPFEPGSCDRIVSSLLFHHLTRQDKLRALTRARELLRPGGELHIADWGKAQNSLMRLAFLGVQLLDGFESTGDNVAGRLPELMRAAGFHSVAETHREMTVFGTLSLYRGVGS
jgi:SAM-dependent methyltransferase